MKIRLLCALIVVFAVPALCGFALGGGEKATQTDILKAGVPAPDWTLKDAEGNVRRLSDFRGKTVIMDFWATWCGPCKLAMPELQEIHEKYGPQGVVVLGMNTWENSDAVKFFNDNGYTYTLLLSADEVAKQYQVQGIPAIFVVDTNGVIHYSRLGYTGDTSLTEKVAAYLKTAQ